MISEYYKLPSVQILTGQANLKRNDREVLRVTR